MKYSLRSLMFVVLVGPPLLAGAWFAQKLFWRYELPDTTTPYPSWDGPPYSRMPRDFDATTTDKEWTEARKEYESGQLLELPNSQVPATNPPKD